MLKRSCIGELLLIIPFVFWSNTIHGAPTVCDPGAPFGFIELMETMDSEILELRTEIFDFFDPIMQDMENLGNDVVTDPETPAQSGVAVQGCGGAGQTGILYGTSGNELSDYAAVLVPGVKRMGQLTKEMAQADSILEKYRVLQRKLMAQRRLMR